MLRYYLPTKLYIIFIKIFLFCPLNKTIYNLSLQIQHMHMLWIFIEIKDNTLKFLSISAPLLDFSIEYNLIDYKLLTKAVGIHFRIVLIEQKKYY